MKINVKIMTQCHPYKGYASAYSVEILNSFNPELKLKDTESAIKNTLTDLLSEWKGFKFVATLVLEFKKVPIDNKTPHSTFYSNTT